MMQKSLLMFHPALKNIITITWLILTVTLLVSPSSECSSSSGDDGECTNFNDNNVEPCLDASEFRNRIASFFQEEEDHEYFYTGSGRTDGGSRILPLLRGTIDDVITKEEIKTLVDLLPESDFVVASGYDDGRDNNSEVGRAYAAPVGYSGIGLKELSCFDDSHESKIQQREAKESQRRYETLIQIRGKVRAATEKSLNLCPNTLLVDFTTISQKTLGGAHRPHADNCLHYFREVTVRDGGSKSIKVATCDPTRQSEHPYPDRVAASILYLNDPVSGNFDGGEFFFANRTTDAIGFNRDGGIVKVKAGRMMYFTSGVENLHGALPVLRRNLQENHQNDDGTDEQRKQQQPRRLALAMWYVFDPLLEEYVPPVQFNVPHNDRVLETEAKESSPSDEKPQTKAKGGRRKKKHDPNDPHAPKELFTIPIPSHSSTDVDNDIGITNSLFQSVGKYLVLQQNKPSVGSWQVNKYGDYTLHVLFKDHSAMFSLDFGILMDDDSDDDDSSNSGGGSRLGIVVERHTDGKKPASLQYMLQESVLLHGVLDELDMLILNEGVMGEYHNYWKDGIEIARNSLPARRA